MFNLPFPIRRLAAIVFVTALASPMAMSVAQAKPQFRDFVKSSSETFTLDGLKAAITIDDQSKQWLRGLVASPNANPPANYNSEDWIRILPPVYATIQVAQNRVFVRKEHTTDFWDGPLTELILKRKGNRFKIEKEILTPYHQVINVEDKVLLGIRYIGPRPSTANVTSSSSTVPIRPTAYDILNEKGGVVGTIPNANGGVRLWNNNMLLVAMRDDSGNIVSLLTDFEGNPVTPPIPNLKVLKTFSIENKSRPFLAVHLEDKGQDWLPLRADGTAPLETVPVKRYFSNGVSSEGSAVEYWFKEYETENGPAFGWAAPDLSEETGPKWKSIEYVKHWFPLSGKNAGKYMSHFVLVGQLLDGTWMSYNSHTVSLATGDQMNVFEPEYQTPQSTQEALLTALTPKYTASGDANMAYQQQAVIKYAAWKEQTKQQAGCAAGDDLYSPACESLRKLRDEYDQAVATDSHERAFLAASQLGGDLFIKHQVTVSRRQIYTIEPERFFHMASSAKDPAVAALARTRYQEILNERKAAAKAVGQAKAAPLPASQTTWPSPNLNASSTFQLPGLSRRQTMDNYLRDYRTWMNGASTYKPNSPF